MQIHCPHLSPTESESLEVRLSSLCFSKTHPKVWESFIKDKGLYPWYTSVVHEPAASVSPENLLEMHHLGPYLRSTESAY